MSLPLRTRGVLAGLVTLAASPLIAVTLLSGSGSHTVSPAAAVSPEATSGDSATSGHGLQARGIGVRIPELAAPEPDPTAAPTAAATAAPTAKPTARPTAEPTASPTPKPVKPAAKVAPPPSAPASAGSIESIIRAAAARHGVSGDWMVKIARCESGMNPRAVNPNGHYGLFQFSYSTFYGHGGTDIWDPSQQSEITARMLSQGQAGQWSCA
ncbi:MAG: transglycosylase SLT domain-containing protein [Candidatus Dormibacteria bacterium]